MKLQCFHCKTEIKGNIYTNRDVREHNESVKNFHGTCFPIYFADKQKQRQQKAMTEMQLKLIQGARHVVLGILGLLCATLGSPQVQAEIPVRSTVQVKVENGAGSGVVVQEGEESLILTADHVVKEEGMTVNGLPVTIVLRDAKRDLALIKVKQRLPAITISEERPDMGSPVMVIGCPFGQCFAVTQGYISSGPDQEGHTTISATAYPGNSGGPVLWYSSLRRKWVLAGIVQGIFASGNFMSRTMVTSITYARMDFMEVLKGIVKVAKLDDATR